MLAGFSKPIDNPGAGFALEHQSAASSAGIRQRLRHVHSIHAEASRIHPAEHAVEAIILHHQHDDVIDWHDGLSPALAAEHAARFGRLGYRIHI
jgi:hypothetical protein